MRISELVQPKQIDSNLSANELNAIYKDLDSRELGSAGAGAYAIGNEVPNDPHMWNKQTTISLQLDNDPYYQYVSAIRKHISANPYLPRVYVTNIRKTEQGAILPNYTMEKLEHGPIQGHEVPKPKSREPDRQFNRGMIMAMGDKMFGSENWVDAALDVSMVDGEPTVWQLLCGLVRTVYETRGQASAIKQYKLKIDPQLVSALRIVSQVQRRNSNFGVDMHAGNFMIRRGASPQFVITDPLDTRLADDGDF